MISAPADWRLLTQAKRDTRASTIPAAWRLPDSLTSQFHERATVSVLDVPRTCGLLTPSEVEITEDYDATRLVELMATGALKSIDVVTAFCKRAAISQQCVNCLTETMFDSALARAHDCDEHLARTGTTLGPLHGLPISLKDSFNVRGVQSTIGYTAFLAHPPAATNSVLVDMLLEAGAVLYVKTNVPHTMMTGDSHNNVFGRTLNPHNLSLSAGGSSGGEGALVAMRGSVLGVGTDIAGSNRIPPLACGISSFKPTSGRLPMAGKVNPGADGNPSAIHPVIGPCGHSSRDYTLFLSALLASSPWSLDPTTLNIPFRTPAATPPTHALKFGLLTNSPALPTHPPILHALETTASSLRAAGHTVVDLTPSLPSLAEAATLAFQYFMLDPLNTPMEHLRAAAEPPIPSIAAVMPPEVLSWAPDLTKLWDMTLSLEKLRATWAALFIREGIDALIMPGWVGTAPPHDAWRGVGWTVVGNMIDYPCAILPVATADAARDAAFRIDGTEYHPKYDPALCQGAPTHIQLMGRPLADEELLGVMQVVEGVLKDSRN